MRLLLVCLAALTIFAGAAAAAEPIEGVWLRANGTQISYAQKGSAFCGTLLNTEYSGHSIGCMSGGGNDYSGEIRKVEENKTYSGKARVTGDTLQLSICALWGLICKEEVLNRQ